MIVANKLFNNNDKWKISLVTLCNLSKPFDSVIHDILICKLHKLNINKFWFDRYFNKRSVCTDGKTLSDKLEITYSVPQGSVLGPLLFLVYVNYLTHLISDDIQFMHTGSIDNIDDLMYRSAATFKIAKYILTLMVCCLILRKRNACL